MRDDQKKALFDTEIRDKIFEEMTISKQNQKQLYLSTLNSQKSIILENRKQLKNFNFLSEQKAVINFHRKYRNMLQAQDRREELAHEQRQNTIITNQRWDDFRVRRDEGIDKYIAARSLQTKVQQLCVYSKMHFYLKESARIFTERKETRTRELKTRFCVFKLA